MRLNKKSTVRRTVDAFMIILLFFIFIAAGVGAAYFYDEFNNARSYKEKEFTKTQLLISDTQNKIQDLFEGDPTAYKSLSDYEELAKNSLEFVGNRPFYANLQEFYSQLKVFNNTVKQENITRLLSNKQNYAEQFKQIRNLSVGEVDAQGDVSVEGLLSLSALTNIPESFKRLAILSATMPDNLNLLFYGNKHALLTFQNEIQNFNKQILIVNDVVKPNENIELRFAGEVQVRNILTLSANLTELYDDSKALSESYIQKDNLIKTSHTLSSILKLKLKSGTINDVDSLETPFGDVKPSIIEILAGISLLVLVYGLFNIFRFGRTGAKIDQKILAQNERNEESILGLLDVMTDLASGDLRVQAKVTDDITGTIADSFNYTVEELRGLVGTVKSSSTKVTSALISTSEVTDKLAEASYAQAVQIKNASNVIAQMNQAMIDVASQTLASAEIALNSTDAARSGAERVRMTIAGMDQIREHIQDTSKRIKLLGESSQEIGDIVELIDDISDQTHLLGLNASIQASAAGEAGKGFALVADQIQRLSERTGNATKRVEDLVKKIQSDTNEAITAMEKSTSEVVNGATLAERAGESLNEIESVSVRLATLIKNVSSASREVADLGEQANKNMETIRELTEQNVESTAITTHSVEQLKELASELRQSVSGFIIP
ncbi:chemotaxis protein [Gammaproteobacteria bacterium]|nr:chemotaxis protein [Gammaproteobacteria bacterium]